MNDLEALYQKAGNLHGSICAGIILGVRMARLGCNMVNLEEPLRAENRKKLMVLVETDRCATDGIQTVTGCTIGRRTLKVMDYGIMAATFINLDSQKAIRIAIHPDSRERAKALFPHLTDKNRVYIEAYKRLPDEALFTSEEVRVHVSDLELPGPPPKKSTCTLCKEEIIEGREIRQEGKTLCRRCARLPLYYHAVRKVPITGFKIAD